MGWRDVWEFVTGQSGKTYANLAKTGVAALSTYASWKDQQKKNEMQQAAYDDYMAQAAQAGHEAQAAVDINLTPMTVSGTPTTKADVTDFTAVAARGGLMSVPNRQRKRYSRGPQIEDVMETEEEIITPYDLQMEEGVNIGEQVKYNTGNSREGAWSVWNSGAIDQELYEFDFEIFFDSGDWSDMLRGQVDVEGDTQMASAPIPPPDYFMTEEEMQISPEEITAMRGEQQAANGGIIGLRYGGRPGYNRGLVVNPGGYAGETAPPINDEVEDALMEAIARKFPNLNADEYTLEDLITMLQISGTMNTEGANILDKAAGLDMITPESVGTSAQAVSRHRDDIAQGGRPGYDRGLGPVGKGLIGPGAIGEGLRPGDDEYEIIITPDGLVVISKEDHDKVMSGEITQQEALENAGHKSGIETVEFGNAKGGLPKRVRKAPGGIMNLGGLEKDYRTTGGFVPIGAYEKKDDVPARLSKNEFVMTADAVRAAGGGSINKGAQRMYDTMKHLEASPQAQRMTA